MNTLFLYSIRRCQNNTCCGWCAEVDGGEALRVAAVERGTRVDCGAERLPLPAVRAESARVDHSLRTRLHDERRPLQPSRRFAPSDALPSLLDSCALANSIG